MPRDRGLEVAMRLLAVVGFVATAIGAAIEVALAGLVWMRSDRVSLAIAALIAAVFLIGNARYPVTMERLQHPEDLGPFIDAASRTVGLVAAFVGSIGAALRS